MKAYFFGCADDVLGHFMHSYKCGSWGHVTGRPSPWGFREIDLAPEKGPQPRGVDQREGPAQLHHRDGWTMLSFWDRSVDSRPGAHGNFIFQGTHDFADMMRLAAEHFPTVVARLRAPLTEHGVCERRRCSVRIGASDLHDDDGRVYCSWGCWNASIVDRVSEAHEAVRRAKAQS